MSPADKVIIAAQVKRLFAVLKESDAKLILVAQVGNPYLSGRDHVWPTPAFYIIDSLDSLS